MKTKVKSSERKHLVNAFIIFKICGSWLHCYFENKQQSYYIFGNQMFSYDSNFPIEE